MDVDSLEGQTDRGIEKFRLIQDHFLNGIIKVGYTLSRFEYRVRPRKLNIARTTNGVGYKN